MAYLVFFFFIIGSAIGSFLNVVIDRSVKRESLMGRSRCDWCRTTLAPIDLMPILSFLILGGRCRHCRKPLSWQYPAVELLGAGLFVATFLFHIGSGQFQVIPLLYLLVIVSVMIIIGVIDLKFYLIPTTFVLALSLIALFYNYFYLSSADFVGHIGAAFGASIFFAIIVLLTLGRGMGEGDVFLAFLIGMILGVKGGFIAIFTAFAVGAIVSLILVFSGKKKFKEAVPFGPFLIFGFFVSLYWGKFLLDWYLMLY